MQDGNKVTLEKSMKEKETDRLTEEHLQSQL